MAPAGPADDVAQHPRVDRALGPQSAHLRRQPGVTVVEADHPIAAREQLFAEAVGPHRQLSADAHDQQDRRVGGVAEIFVEDLNRCRALAADRRPASGLHAPKLRFLMEIARIRSETVVPATSHTIGLIWSSTPSNDFPNISYPTTG